MNKAAKLRVHMNCGVLEGVGCESEALLRRFTQGTSEGDELLETALRSALPTMCHDC